MGISLEDLKRAQKERNERVGVLQQSLNRLCSKQNEIVVVQKKEELETLRKNLLSTKNSEQNLSTNMKQRIQNYSAKIIKEVDDQLKESSLELLFVLDQSISCSGTESSTIKGFDDLIRKELNHGYWNTKVSVVLFSNREELKYDRENISQVKSFQYVANGRATALYDSLGNQINRIKQIHQVEGSPTKTLVVIMTDGKDNDSYSFNEETIKILIKERQKAGWEFLYLGALDCEDEVFNEARKIGISMDHCQLYLPEFVDKNFLAIAQAINDLRGSGKINPHWSQVIKNTIHSNQSIEMTVPKALRLERKNN